MVVDLGVGLGTKTGASVGKQRPDCSDARSGYTFSAGAAKASGNRGNIVIRVCRGLMMWKP